MTHPKEGNEVEASKSFLATVQAALKAPKSQFNSFGKYSYRSAEDIIEAVKPLINPHGYYLTTSDEIVQIGDRFYVKATARLSNDKESWDATAFAREQDDKKGMVDAQVTGSVSSYARKYALNGLLAIDDTRDCDTNHAPDDKGKAKAPTKPKPDQASPPPSTDLQLAKAKLRTSIEQYAATERAKTIKAAAVLHDTLVVEKINGLEGLATCTNPMVFAKCIEVLEIEMKKGGGDA